MRNYAGTCKCICSYNLAHNFLIQLLSLQSSAFVVHFSNTYQHGNESFPKGSSQFLKLNFSSPCNLSFAKQLIQECENMFSLVWLSKSKFCTRVALVSNSCRTFVASVSLMLHLCLSCRTSVVLVLLLILDLVTHCFTLLSSKIYFFLSTQRYNLKSTNVYARVVVMKRSQQGQTSHVDWGYCFICQRKQKTNITNTDKILKTVESNITKLRYMGELDLEWDAITEIIDENGN